MVYPLTVHAIFRGILLCALALTLSSHLHAADPTPVQAPPALLNAAGAAELDAQAAALEAKGNFAEAFPLAQRAFEARVRINGGRHPDTASSHYTLATLYEDKGDLAAAESHYAQALEIRETTLGKEHPETAQVLNAMGNTLYQRGQFPRAETLWRRALAIREKTAGPDSVEAAKPINNLAAVLQAQGDAAGAIEFYRRALAIFEKRLGPDHPITANTLNNLGVIYRDMLGDLDSAEDYLQRALRSRESHLGPDHPAVAGTLTNLAAVFMDRGEYDRAVKILQRALPIYEKANGPTHPDTIRVRNDLGVGLARAGQFDAGEALDKEAIRINEQALGPDHPQLASALNNLADLYRARNKPAEAEPLAARAEGIYRRVFGNDHPDICLALAVRAGALLDLERNDEAGELAVQLAHARERALGNVLSFAPEAQRLTFQASREDVYSLLATLGESEPLEEALLRSKSVVLDSLLEDRLVAIASADPARRQQIDEARTKRRELTRLQLDPPGDPGPEAIRTRDERKQELAARIDEIEGGMARQVAGVGRARRALGVTVAQVRAALPRDAVLIDFVRYAHNLGHDRAVEERYGAVVLTRDQPPHWTALGSASALDEQMAIYRRAVRGEAADPLALETVLGDLYRIVWEPLARLVPAGAAQIFISPDSELNFLSFATLLTPDDRFLAERHAITCLASGRDVLPAAETPGASVPENSKPNLVVFANPRMRNESLVRADNPAPPDLADSAAGRVTRLAYRDLRLGPLPGAQAEADGLARFAREQGWEIETLLGAAATERQLLGVHHPRILHLATHGFFLPSPDDSVRAGNGTDTRGVRLGAPPSSSWSNPMRRSGLALAGAGGTLEAWSAGSVPATADDGIVTAEEVSTLDLHGTWLVVLSACESGGGEIRSGEGVLGLRRGFILAGAQHLLLTLWPVGDEETSALILDFYAKAEKTRNPALALAETQRDHLVRLRHRQGLNAAVRLAGGFILSSAHQ